MKFCKSFFLLLLCSLYLSNPLLAQESNKYGPDDYYNDTSLKYELNLVYIGASWCPPCLEDRLKEALEELKMKLYKRAQKKKMNYSVIGVANDQSVQKGWDFLNSSGYFDEVIIGKKWRNTGSINFIWNNEKAKPEVPQIVVFKRKVSYGNRINVGKKIYLARVMGYPAIKKWLDNGAPLKEK